MNASNAQAQDILKQHEEGKKTQGKNDLAAVMSTPEGRRFVWSLIVSAGTFEASFQGELPLSNAFGEGQRSFGIALFERVKIEATDLYIVALNEALAEQRKEHELRKAAAAEAANQQEEE